MGALPGVFPLWGPYGLAKLQKFYFPIRPVLSLDRLRLCSLEAGKKFLLIGSVRSLHFAIELRRVGLDVGVPDALVFNIPVE